MKPSLNSYRLDCHSLHPLESISQKQTKKKPNLSMPLLNQKTLLAPCCPQNKVQIPELGDITWTHSPPLEHLSCLRGPVCKLPISQALSKPLWHAGQTAFHLFHLVSLYLHFMTQLKYPHQFSTRHSHFIHICTSSGVYSLNTETWESALTSSISTLPPSLS